MLIIFPLFQPHKLLNLFLIPTQKPVQLPRQRQKNNCKNMQTIFLNCICQKLKNNVIIFQTFFLLKQLKNLQLFYLLINLPTLFKTRPFPSVLLQIQKLKQKISQQHQHVLRQLLK